MKRNRTARWSTYWSARPAVTGIRGSRVPGSRLGFHLADYFGFVFISTTFLVLRAGVPSQILRTYLHFPDVKKWHARPLGGYLRLRSIVLRIPAKTSVGSFAMGGTTITIFPPMTPKTLCTATPLTPSVGFGSTKPTVSSSRLIPGASKRKLSALQDPACTLLKVPWQLQDPACTLQKVPWQIMKKFMADRHLP